jgi:hypothetical protein
MEFFGATSPLAITTTRTRLCNPTSCVSRRKVICGVSLFLSSPNDNWRGANLSLLRLLTCSLFPHHTITGGTRDVSLNAFMWLASMRQTWMDELQFLVSLSIMFRLIVMQYIFCDVHKQLPSVFGSQQHQQQQDQSDVLLLLLLLLLLLSLLILLQLQQAWLINTINCSRSHNRINKTSSNSFRVILLKAYRWNAYL